MDYESELLRKEIKRLELIDEFYNDSSYMKNIKHNKIICAAIYINDNIKHEHTPLNIDTGFIICGRRHYNCFNIMSLLVNDEKKVLEYKNMCTQGFLTDNNLFIDRKTAAAVAFNSGQISDPRIEELFSEDLY